MKLEFKLSESSRVYISGTDFIKLMYKFNVTSYESIIMLQFSGTQSQVNQLHSFFTGTDCGELKSILINDVILCNNIDSSKITKDVNMSTIGMFNTVNDNDDVVFLNCQLNILRM